MNGKIKSFWQKCAVEILALAVISIAGAVYSAVGDVRSLKEDQVVQNERVEFLEERTDSKLKEIDSTTKKILCLALGERSQCK